MTTEQILTDLKKQGVPGGVSTIKDCVGMPLDFSIKVVHQLGWHGQGVCPCLRVPIRSRGGWCEFWFDWTPRLHSHVGCGLDDPIDRDSLLGRVYNHFIFANLTFDITDRFVTGLEVSSWKTLYQETRVGQIPPDRLTASQPGEAIVIDWMVRYGF